MSLTLRSTPRISAAKFKDVLAKGSSPITPIAFECYDIIAAAGLDPAILLSIFAKESQYGVTGIAPQTKSWGNVRTAQVPARSPVIIQGFAAYPNWRIGLIDLCDRLNLRYVARGLDTVEKAIPVYAPSSENDTAGYIAFVRDHVAAWQAQEVAIVSTSDGWMPNVDTAKSPNHWQGRAGQRAHAVVLHIAQGGYAGSISWLCNPAAGASAHFMVAKDGRITQMVSILDTAWGNGLRWSNAQWYDPEGTLVHPTWPLLTPGIDPNRVTVSIEHEGNSGDVWAAAEIAADARICTFVASVFPMTYVPHTTLIGHYEISPINRAHCPGTGCPFDTIAAAANGQSTPVPAPTMVYLKALYDSNVRQGPGTSFPVALVMAAGETAGFDLVPTPGQYVQGDNRWMHRADARGFVWAGLLSAA